MSNRLSCGHGRPWRNESFWSKADIGLYPPWMDDDSSRRHRLSNETLSIRYIGYLPMTH